MIKISISIWEQYEFQKISLNIKPPEGGCLFQILGKDGNGGGVDGPSVGVTSSTGFSAT